MMRAVRVRWLFVACVLFGAGAARAQDAALSLPPGDARIVGQVLHREGDAPARDIEVVLYALREDGAPGIARTRSDADGRFEFARISSSPAISYLLGARYRELPYPGERVVFAPGAQVAQSVIRIAELTAAPDALRPAGVTLRVQREARGLRVEHSVRTRNEGARTFYRAENARGVGADAAFEVTLPRGASAFEMPLGAVPEGLRRRGRRLSYFGPIHPGEHELAFRYLLAGERAADDARRFTLRARAPEGVPVELRMPRGLGEVRAPRLQRARDPHIHDANDPAHAHMELEERWTSDAGGAFEIALTLPPARSDPDAVRVLAARAVLSMDDVTLDVNESYTLEILGDATQLASAAQPFLLVTLPPGAREVHSGSDAPDVRLEAHASTLPALGAHAPLSEDERAQTWLAAVGSAQPGRFQVGVRYRLAVDETRSAHFARRFAARVPAFAIFLADSGDLAPESARLHRRRPLREPDRNYLHFEAFEVERGEVVTLAIGRRARAGQARGPLALGAAALLALCSVLFLAAPLRAGAARVLREPRENEAARERAALVAAIHDLDHDYETGKLSAHDHAELRNELRTRAIEALRQERAAAQDEATRAQDGNAPGAQDDARAATARDSQADGAHSATMRNTQADGAHSAAPHGTQHGVARDATPRDAQTGGAHSATTRDAQTSGAHSAGEAAASCPQCAAGADPAHRFCPACGVRLQSDAPA